MCLIGTRHIIQVDFCVPGGKMMNQCIGHRNLRGAAKVLVDEPGSATSPHGGITMVSFGSITEKLSDLGGGK